MTAPPRRPARGSNRAAHGSHRPAGRNTHPPTAADELLRRCLPEGVLGATIIGDLHQELDHLVREAAVRRVQQRHSHVFRAGAPLRHGNRPHAARAYGRGRLIVRLFRLIRGPVGLVERRPRRESLLALPLPPRSEQSRAQRQ